MPNCLRPLFLLLLLSAALSADINNTKECVNDNDTTGGDSTCAATNTDSIDNIDNAADNLLQEGIHALTQEKDSQKAISIFEELALDYPNYEQMHAVQKFNGVALSNLGHGSKALWCFKNAMLLANEYPAKQLLESLKRIGMDINSL